MHNQRLQHASGTCAVDMLSQIPLAEEDMIIYYRWQEMGRALGLDMYRHESHANFARAMVKEVCRHTSRMTTEDIWWHEPLKAQTSSGGCELLAPRYISRSSYSIESSHLRLR